MVFYESNRRMNVNRKTKSAVLTQIDSVKRDMQFSVRQQLQQMEILKRVMTLWLIKGNDSFMQIGIFVMFTVTAW